jgi:hypothetical protein
MTCPLVADKIRKQAMAAIVQWYPARNNAESKPAPFQAQELNLLLTHNTTEHFSLALRPGASTIVLMIQGFPAHNVWPILHIDLDGCGTQLLYANDSRTQARPWIMALSCPIERRREMNASISLLNGNENGGDVRNALIGKVYVF